MRHTHPARAALVAAAIASLAACSDAPVEPGASPEIPLEVAVAARSPERLAAVGALIFFDRDLSINRNQSCAACHDPAWGFTGPDTDINRGGAVYEGSIPGAFGDRKPPSSAYSTQSPVLAFDGELWIGGHFWDGRATGQRLGWPAAEQAQGPFLNPVEQALRDEACVVYRVSRAAYAPQYVQLFGRKILQIPFPSDIDASCAQQGGRLPLSDAVRARVRDEYDRIALAIATYEASPEVDQFSSKYDAYLAGLATLTSEERRGLELFNGKALCSACHPSAGQRALFTDFSYDNVGAPRNPANPVYDRNPGFVDLGLGGFLGDPAEYGKMKVPTLRNVDLRPHPGAMKAYFHNGVFKSLDMVVHFYNTRDVLPKCESVSRPDMGVNCWPAPEVAVNVNTDELGNLGLTRAEERAIVAFMRTLSDGYAGKP
jgi:cytochrome c peroxidase